MENMLTEIEWCKRTMKMDFRKSVNMTEEDKKDFETADKCHICGEKYSENDTRERDYCQITGNYRGSAHDYCHSKLKINPKNIKIPILNHNLRGCYNARNWRNS